MDDVLYNLLIQETHLLLGAEKEQSVRLRELTESARNKELQVVFEQHARETEDQIVRLKEVLTAVGEPVEGEVPVAIDGLLEDAEMVADQDLQDGVRDIAIASAARKMEHYEIGCYESIIALAEQLSLGDIASSLRKSLKEEERADHRIAEALKHIHLDLTAQDLAPPGLVELL